MFISEYTIGFYLWIGIFELNSTFPGNESLTGGGILFFLLLNKITVFTILDRMSDIIFVYHESNEQRATRDPRDQADQRNQRVGLVFYPTSKYDFELNVLHDYSVLRVSIGLFLDACRICQLVTSRTIQRDITMVSTKIQGCISIL